MIIVSVEQDGSRLRVRTKYNARFVEAAREVPGMTWDKSTKSYIAYEHTIPLLTQRMSEHGLNCKISRVSSIKGEASKFKPMPLASSLSSTLRPYQLEGAQTLLASPGWVLDWGMRVGKTPTGSVALASALASGQVRTALILYPGGVKAEWDRQFTQFSGGLPLTPLEGFTQLTADEKNELIRRPFLALGCGYEILEGQIKNEQTGRPMRTKELREDLREILQARGKFIALADELQMLQNRKAGRTMAAAQLARLPNCEARWGLTGTLQRNTPKNLWQPLDFIQPDGWGGYWNFAKRYCNPPEAPIWMGDFSFKALGEIQIGDEVIGWKRVVGKRAKTEKHGRDQLVRAKVLSIHLRQAPVVRVGLASGHWLRCTADHLWLATNNAAALGYGYLPPKMGRDLIQIVDINTPVIADARLAGWVAGMYDGEGTGAFISQSSVVNPTTWNQLDHALTVLGIPHSMRRDTKASAGGAQILGGRAGFLRFLKICRPVRRSRWDQVILGGRFRNPDEVVSIRPDGVSEVISMKTTTGNYVAWGYASKNCEAYEGEHGWVDDGSSNEEELNGRIRSFSSKLTRQDVAPWLPKSERTIQPCSLTGAAMKTYVQQEKIIGGAAIAAIRGSADETALRQLASLTAPSKVEKLVERVRAHQLQGNKVVVFSHFHETLDVAEQALLKAGIVPHCAPGSKPPEQRKKRIEEWKADPTPAPLLVNTLSSGVGIDLADATAAIFVELSYVPADFLQAEARIQDVHLGKRTTPPLYEYLICRGTIDEDMGIALLSKLSSIDRTVGVDDDARDVADTLRNSGLINSGAAGLVDERESTIDSVIERMKARMRGEMSDPSASLAASVEAAFDEGEAIEEEESE